MTLEPLQENIAELMSIARTTLDLVQDYRGRPKRERDLDPMLYALLSSRYGNRGSLVKRQYPIRMLGSDCRVDFRVGGPNPILIEFAFRPSTGGGDLCSSTNRSELLKLSRFPQTEAKLRALLLVDACVAGPYDRARLKEKYGEVKSGPGKIERNPVRVIYAHPQKSFHFCWRP